MNLKLLFGTGSLIVALIGYAPYINNVLRGHTKPHAYSWLVWAVLAVVGFGIQVQDKGGAGSWLLGLTAVATLFIFFLSLRFGHKEILRIDKISLFFAALALVLWAYTDQPLLAAILITLVEAAGGFFPTFRKSYYRPESETALAYFTYATSICLSLAALDNYSLVNMLYPGVTFFLNAAMVTFLLIRRLQLKV